CLPRAARLLHPLLVPTTPAAGRAGIMRRSSARGVLPVCAIDAGRKTVAVVNEHYLKLKSSYLFTEIARRVRAFQEEHPEAAVIRLGIGDVTRPLPPAVVRALHAAVD